MKNKKTVYLAGPISGLTYEEATAWRKEARLNLEEIGFDAIDPMHGKKFLSDVKKTDQARHNKLIARHDNIFLTDIYRVRNSEIILVNFLGAKQVSIGTTIEIGLARELGKLIVIVMDEGNIHDHVFITAGCVIAPTMQQALEYLRVVGGK